MLSVSCRDSGVLYGRGQMHNHRHLLLRSGPKPRRRTPFFIMFFFFFIIFNVFFIPVLLFFPPLVVFSVCLSVFPVSPTSPNPSQVCFLGLVVVFPRPQHTKTKILAIAMCSWLLMFTETRNKRNTTRKNKTKKGGRGGETHHTTHSRTTTRRQQK